MQKNRKSKIFNIINSNYMVIFIIIIVIILKQIMVSNLPIFARSTSIFDDELMVKLAEYISSGQWLGPYNYLTLMKGSFFSFFLTFCKWTELSYIGLQTFIYSMSVCYFAYAINPIIKNKWFKVLFIIILIFNPISYSTYVLCIVYRNSVTIWQVLFVFGSYIGMYLNRNGSNKKNLFFAIVGGFALAFMFNNREDSIWIAPFVIVVTFILIGILLYKKWKITHKFDFKKCTIFVLPLIVLFTITNSIKMINYHYYKIYATTETGHTSFQSAMESMHKVKIEEEGISRVSVSRKKLEYLYTLSPTLNNIKEELERCMDNWSKWDTNKDDNEVEDGWFIWAFRNAAFDAGIYKDGKEVEEFYKKIGDEINEQIETGNVKTQITMPSALMSPWREEYLKEIIPTFIESYRYVTTFKDIDLVAQESISNGSNGIERFESITNNLAIYPNKNTLNLSGWYFNYKDKVELYVENEEGTLKEKIEFLESNDIYEYFKNEKYKNTKKARFNQVISFENQKEELYLKVYKKEKLIEAIKIDKTFEVGETRAYSIDDVSKFINNSKITYNDVNNDVDRLNNVGNIYKKSATLINAISFISTLYLTVSFIRECIKKKYKEQNLNNILILYGLYLSFVLLLIGISYTHISAWPAIRILYLTGAYPLYNIFTILSIIFCVEKIKKNYVK